MYVTPPTNKSHDTWWMVSWSIVDLQATCGRLSDAYKLFEGLRSLKVGVDHMVVHDGMFIHAGIMNRDIQNEIYTILLWLSFTLNMENRGCFVIICKCGGILEARDDPKVVLWDVEYKHWTNYWRSVQSRLSEKDSWLASVLQKTGWGRIIISFPSFYIL